MDSNNKSNAHLLSCGDLLAIRNAHAQLHALLAYICQDSFTSFSELDLDHQRALLRLALTTSLNIGDYLENFSEN